MGTYNPDFWEIPTDPTTLSLVSSERSIWHTTEEDKAGRQAVREFYQEVLPAIQKMMSTLTAKQRQVVELYFYKGLTQEEIKNRLGVSQSTVSRHLFGTVRDGKIVGGAIPKIQKIIEGKDCPAEVRHAIRKLRETIPARSGSTTIKVFQNRKASTA